MKRIPIIRRRDLVNAGIPNSQLINLSERNEYFRSRPGDRTFYGPFNALLVFIASELFDFLPFRNVSDVLDYIVRDHRDIYVSLALNPRQLLLVERQMKEIIRDTDLILPMSHYELVFKSFDEMPLFNWNDHEAMVAVNLEKIYSRLEELFEAKGVEVPDEDIE